MQPFRFGHVDEEIVHATRSFSMRTFTCTYCSVKTVVIQTYTSTYNIILLILIISLSKDIQLNPGPCFEKLTPK